MSGGRWDYGRNLEDNAEALRRLTAMNEVMQAIEHEVDWGVCDDTCSACAKLRIISALEQFFDDRSSDPVAAIAIARDHLQNRCPKCVKQYCLVCGYSYTSAGSCSNSKCASKRQKSIPPVPESRCLCDGVGCNSCEPQGRG